MDFKEGGKDCEAVRRNAPFLNNFEDGTKEEVLRWTVADSSATVWPSSLESSTFARREECLVDMGNRVFRVLRSGVSFSKKGFFYRGRRKVENMNKK